MAGAEAFIANGILTHNCSYGHRLPSDADSERDWKNMRLMSDAAMPEPKAMECLESFQRLGVRAVEITGGGEPLIWPPIDRFFEALARTDLETALVTNGTALTEERAELFAATRWKWARVSIDAGTEKQYVMTRRVSGSHWTRAWEAVRLLAARAIELDQRVGVGYVVDLHNARGIYEAAVRARDAGAHNIRLSLAMTPRGLSRFEEAELAAAMEDAARASADLGSTGFHVIDLLRERQAELRAVRQDYDFCGVKEVLCVVGGDLNVYTCCVLAFNPKGLVGSIRDQSFESLWRSRERAEEFGRHNPRRICTCECMYEARNRRILGFLASLSLPVVEPGAAPLHVNFA